MSVAGLRGSAGEAAEPRGGAQPAVAEASPAERVAAKCGISEPNSRHMHAIMPYHMFVVPIHDDGSAIAELNGFLRSHKVLSVDRRWVDLGTESFWSFCVDYLERGAGGPQAGKGGAARGKVDYREVLNPEDFAVFARLRQMRKEIAQAVAVPVYAVFTNEQLAQMVQTRATTKAALERIAGVGDARIEKYGPRFLELLGKQWVREGTDEASRKPV